MRTACVFQIKEGAGNDKLLRGRVLFRFTMELQSLVAVTRRPKWMHLVPKAHDARIRCRVVRDGRWEAMNEKTGWMGNRLRHSNDDIGHQVEFW
jgi:hypothetical protein